MSFDLIERLDAASRDDRLADGMLYREAAKCIADYLSRDVSYWHKIMQRTDKQAKRITELEAELEKERLRLAGCGVVANANTPESAKKARNMHPDYQCASIDDVAVAVDSEMKYRAALEQVRGLPEKWRGEVNVTGIPVQVRAAVENRANELEQAVGDKS